MQGAAERLLPSGKEGAAADEAKGEAGATVQSAIFNLSNTIIGSGVLAMPFACYRCGTILFVILVAVTAFASHTAMVILIGAAEKLRDKLREDARMRKHNTAPASEAGAPTGGIERPPPTHEVDEHSGDPEISYPRLGRELLGRAGELLASSSTLPGNCSFR